MSDEELCPEKLSEEAIRGIEYFNSRAYFEAHEWLEIAWKADKSASRGLYKAILHVAVAYYQIERQNYIGALKMFSRVRQWIDPLPESCAGVDVRTLRIDKDIALAEVRRLGPERLSQFDQSLFKKIRLI